MANQLGRNMDFDKWDERLLGLLKDFREYCPVNRRQRSYREFLGAPLKEILILHEDFAFYQYPAVERTIRTLLKDWTMVDERRFHEVGEEYIPLYIPVEVEEGVFENVLEEGVRYYENRDDGRRLIIRTEVNESPEGIKYFARVWFAAEKEKERFLKELIQDVKIWIRKNHYLKGKKLKPDGSLLNIPRTLFYYGPDDFQINPKVLMDQLIPHTCHAFPGDIGVSVFYLVRDFLGCFSKDFKTPDHCLDSLFVPAKLLES